MTGRSCAASLDAEQLADHRLAYLSYEGPLRGDRGSVIRWDAGSYQTVAVSEAAWHVRLQGERLVCELLLTRVADQRWSASFTGGDATRG